jgi:hypothetical protein
MYSGLFHYNAEVVPILILATIEAMALILWLAQRTLVHIRGEQGNICSPIPDHLVHSRGTLSGGQVYPLWSP